MMSRRPAEGGGGQAPAIGEGERVGARLIAIFCVGLILFSPLVIAIFDRGADARVLGLPLLYFYLFTAWAVLITMLAWVLERRSRVKSGLANGPEDGRDRDGVPR